MSVLEARFWETDKDREEEVKRRVEAERNLKKCEREIKTLTFQNDDYTKDNNRMNHLVDDLQVKIKAYKHQIEEAEEIAAFNLARYRKLQQQVEDAEERAYLAEQKATKARWKGGAQPIST